MSDQISEQAATVRDWAVAKLAEVESALRDVDDVAAMEIVQRAISELQGDLGVPDREGSWRRATADRMRQAAAAIGSSIDKATDNATTAARAGVTRATGDLATAAAVVSEKGSAMVRSGVYGAAAGLGVAHGALTDFADNLDWSTVLQIAPADYLNRFVTAGTYGVDRTLDQARLVWETLPEQLRAMGSEEVSKRLWGAESLAERFDWSHIVPHSQGGSNEAANGIFEIASVNRSRGAELMRPQEYDAAVQVLSDTAFEAALVETASQVLSGAGVGAAVSCVLSCLEYGLEYQRGEISRAEMYQRIGRAMAKSASIGAAVAGVLAVAALAFPAVIPLAAPLVGPLAILGFCAVGGKVVRLGKGWYEVYQDTFGREVPGLRLGFQGNSQAADFDYLGSGR